MTLTRPPSFSLPSFPPSQMMEQMMGGGMGGTLSLCSYAPCPMLLRTPYAKSVTPYAKSGSDIALATRRYGRWYAGHGRHEGRHG
eukprot:1192747-Rhodomonas_salina.2